MSEKKSSFWRSALGGSGARAEARAIRACLVGLVCQAFLGCSGEEATRAPLDDSPNILLISIDTLRADRLGSYGYARPTTPNLDRLAGQGVLFEQAFAQRAQTWPSMTSVLTSLQPFEHGVRENGAKLARGVPTLPEMLQARRYQTAAFLTNMKHASNRGFDEKHFAKREDRDAHVNELAIGWLKQRAREPFFGWVHYIAPHRPNEAPERFAQRFAPEYHGDVDGSFESLAAITREKRALSEADLAYVNGLYDAEVAYADSLVGELLAELAQRGFEDRTLVVVLGDHGEELYDHNAYFFHSCSIYDSTLRIPLLMRWPGQLPAGRRIPAVVQSVDIAPTILDLIGLPVPASLRGSSLVALLRGAEDESGDEAVAFAEIGPEVRSIRTKRWRYVENPRSYRPDCRPYRDAWMEGRREIYYEIPTRALYDLAEEDRERTNVLERYPDVAADLAARLRIRFESAGRTGPPVALDPEVEAELKELGYIQ